VELLLLIQYSGSDGLAAGFCRQCSLSLSLDILPVLYITDWFASDADRSACLPSFSELPVFRAGDNEISLIVNFSESSSD